MLPSIVQRIMTWKNKRTKPKVLASKKLGFSRAQLPDYVVSIVDKLQKNNHQAFIVGGAVRDLLVGRVPKDFDVATSARPEQVTAIFRRSRIVGRRFRIVHVYHRAIDYVEVTTFRGGRDEQNKDSFGRVIDDNSYGSVQEDAFRRDFSINALYYDPRSEKIYDYTSGFSDIRSQVLRVIGDPDQRFREDPVRMLRAIRFSHKLFFSLPLDVSDSISQHAHLLKNIPAARLFDELVKIFLSGQCLSCLKLIFDMGIDQSVIPLLKPISHVIKDEFVEMSLKKTDGRVLNGQSVGVIFLFASLFWPLIRDQWLGQDYTKGYDRNDALIHISHDLVESLCTDYGIPRRIMSGAREIWLMQLRFCHRSVSRATRFMAHHHFRLGYDFMLLRAEMQEIKKADMLWWRDLVEHKGPQPKKKPANRSSHKPMR